MPAPHSISLGRIAECEEVASLVAYLASDLAHFINGTMIEIDEEAVNRSSPRPIRPRGRQRFLRRNLPATGHSRFGVVGIPAEMRAGEPQSERSASPGAPLARRYASPFTIEVASGLLH
jgi:hypothetical protein